ncbi:MAG: hypothetical protein JWP97_3628 [Labilithrix sp.]|nr:hypothetical protein [Labilithrix sp.]
MGDSRALPGFGQVDLELDAGLEVGASGRDTPPSRVVPQHARSVLPPPMPPPRPARHAPKLTPQVSPRVLERLASETGAPTTRRNMAAASETTRIVGGAALADLLESADDHAGDARGDSHGNSHGNGELAADARPTPVPHASHDEPRTRAWSNVDEQLMAYQSMVSPGAEPDEEPPSHPSIPSRPSYPSRPTGPSRPSAPSRSGGGSGGSGVASRDRRVAAMRELYAQGDAEGALALAADISDSLHPPANGEVSAVLPVAGDVRGVHDPESSFAGDPFGGLIPLDDDGLSSAGLSVEVLVETDAGLVERPAASHRDHHDHGAAFLASAAREPRFAVPPLAPPSMNREPQGDVASPPLSLTERHSIPTMLKSLGEVARLPIDHRAGFLLAHVDGMQTLEEILDVCAMPPLEALDLIRKLEEMGVIAFE